MENRVNVLARWIIAAGLAANALGAGAATPDEIESAANNLLVVLRETPGKNKEDEGLQPFGKIATRLPDGRDHEFEASWFHYIGDLHLRIVFDGVRQVRSAVPGDLQRLEMTPQQALDRAIANMRKRYGAPIVTPWSGGIQQVLGDSPELSSSYFLDRAFWLEQAKSHPEGLLVAVPRRGGLLFGPVDNDVVRTNLQFSVTALYTGDRNRLSSALYLFKDGRWSVWQPAQQPVR